MKVCCLRDRIENFDTESDQTFRRVAGGQRGNPVIDTVAQLRDRACALRFRLALELLDPGSAASPDLEYRK